MSPFHKKAYYTFTYELPENKKNRAKIDPDLMSIRSDELSKMDLIVLKHGLITKNDMRRIEYLLYDAIRHGGYNSLISQGTCYDLEELYKRIMKRRNEFKKKDDDEPFIQLLLNDPPDRDKVNQFPL